MRPIASLYLAIALVNFGFWLSTGVDQEFFPTAYSYLTWSLYFFSLLALLAFSLDKLLLSQLQWRVLFAVYLSVRVYELLTRELVLTGVGLSTDLNIIGSYLWLVIPPGLAMWHLGFRLAPYKSKSYQPQQDAGELMGHGLLR